MAIHTCTPQGVIVFSVHVGALADEEPHDGFFAKCRGIAKRYVGPRHVHCGAVLEEELHHVRMIIRRCQHQRTIAIIVDVCTVLEEQLHHVRVAILRGRLQWKIVTRVNIRAVLDQELQNVRVAPVGCRAQCPVVIGVHIRTRAQEQPNSLGPPTNGSVPQGRVQYTPLGRRLVFPRVDASLQQWRAVLVHTSSQHAADNPQVAKETSALQAAEPLNTLKVACARRLVRTGAQRPQCSPPDQEGLVYGRQTRQLNGRQVAQHQDERLREQGSGCMLQQLRQLVAGCWRLRC